MLDNIEIKKPMNEKSGSNLIFKDMNQSTQSSGQVIKKITQSQSQVPVSQSLIQAPPQTKISKPTVEPENKKENVKIHV